MEVYSSFQATFFLLSGSSFQSSVPPMTEAWVTRLNQWLATAGWSPAEYARRVNADSNRPAISEWSIRKYLGGGVTQPRKGILARLAEPFGKSEAQLLYGVDIDNITHTRNAIPLLTATDIGTLDPTKSLSTWEGRSVNLLSNEGGQNWFGVVVPDDACAPRIARGAIAYCDPDAPVSPGDYVIARIPGVTAGVCRRFRQTDGLDKESFRLLPENQDYPGYESSPDRPITIWRIVKVLSDP
jgi:peptidase S24-like protein